MRILVDLADSRIKALDALAKAERKPRSALIRQAIDDYLTRRRAWRESDAFGLWADREVDGLAYQKKARGEWR
ncbi:MAG: ribbon-helix-helix protein, CopG family [Reyranella sp.]|nr:ribbon-helix-helix protein, CopG family [Reyranella sp.]